MSELEEKIYRTDCAAVIAQQVDGPNALSQEYANDTKQPLKGRVEDRKVKGDAEDVLLKGTIQKGEQILIPQEAHSDNFKRVDPPGKMQVRDWEYVAMPPTEFSSDGVKKAYADVGGKWHRGWHRIPVHIDLDGDHETDAYDRYPLMWSIPEKLKLASSREAAVEITGKIMLRNERSELIETKDYYCAKVWDDHIDNLAHNIRADGYIMHFDHATQSWWRLSQLKYIFNHVEGRGTCYGPDLPATSGWDGPDMHINESPPRMYGDPVDGDKHNLVK